MRYTTMMQDSDLPYLTRCTATGTTAAVVRALGYATHKKAENTQSESAQRTYRNFNILLISNPSEATNLANDMLLHMKEQLESIAACFDAPGVRTTTKKRDSSVLQDTPKCTQVDQPIVTVPPVLLPTEATVAPVAPVATVATVATTAPAAKPNPEKKTTSRKKVKTTNNTT